MREMKDSGLEWVGQVSSNCSFVPLKYFLESKDSIKVGPFGSQLSGNDFADDVTDYWVYNQRTVIDNEYETGNAYIQKEKFDSMTSFQVHTDDILITTRGTIGKISKVPKNHKHGILHPCIIRFRIDPRKYSYKLLEIIFNSSDFVTRQIIYKSNATTIEVIYSDTLKNIILPYFNLDTQNSIADFLEKKCEQLNSTVNEIHHQIETLEQYKRSVITEVVTKGLDPDVEMRDSGYSWCPFIPKHWHKIPSKYLFRNSDIRKYPDDVQLTASQKYGIISQIEYMERENAKIVLANQGIDNWKHVEPNDFIISLRSFQGGLELSEVRGCITWHYIVLKATKPIIHRYYKWLFKSFTYIKALQGTCNFIRDGQDLRYSNFVQVPIFQPPLEEQQQIAEYLDSKITEIDSIIANKEKQIETIEEYKKSLIFEYVTGKKEVQS